MNLYEWDVILDIGYKYMTQSRLNWSWIETLGWIPDPSRSIKISPTYSPIIQILGRPRWSYYHLGFACSTRRPNPHPHRSIHKFPPQTLRFDPSPSLRYWSNLYSQFIQWTLLKRLDAEKIIWEAKENL